MNLTLFPYQQNDVDNIIAKFQHHKKILYQLSTGGGKTFVFSFLAKYVVERHKKKVVILCHKEELIDQTIASLNAIGITAEAVKANTRKLHHKADAYVCMIETVYNRLQKNPDFFRDVFLVIADECHILIFQKVYDYFKKAKILGCTATPVVDKKVTFYKCKYCKTTEDFPTMCCGEDMREWVKPFALSNIYEDIVTGITIKELIEMGRLIQEISFVKKYTDNSNLKVGSDGDYTAESMTQAYGTESAVFDCVLNYKEICEGKKTMVFNPTTTTNKLVHQKFLDAGYNSKMYDSVNNTKAERKAIVDWFENTPDAILNNVGCFTTGFDVTDVEAVILNRPINSLSLFLQMVGRGGRTTSKIFKDYFIVIDGGGNIEKFNEWSDNTRDWEAIFRTGIGKEREKRGKNDVTDVQACENCGYLMPKSVDVCEGCGESFKKKDRKPATESQEVMEAIRQIPPPNAKKIHEYTLKLKENCNFAFKIVISQIVDMFKFYRVSRATYVSTLGNGKLKKKVERMIQACYFYLIAQDDIKTDNNRKISYIYNKVIDKLNTMYNLTTKELEENQQANE